MENNDGGGNWRSLGPVPGVSSCQILNGWSTCFDREHSDKQI